MAPAKSYTKKRTFKKLTVFDRGKIALLCAAGKSMQASADEIGYHKSTVSCELKRGIVTQMKNEILLRISGIDRESINAKIQYLQNSYGFNSLWYSRCG